MTIKGLWKIVKDKSPRSNKVVPRKSFKGYRIAIDANGMFYTLRAVALKRVVMKTDAMIDDPDVTEVDRIWLDSALNEIICMISTGITPILVYDGKPLIEKLEEHKTRTKTKDNYKKQLEDVRAQRSTNSFKDDKMLQNKARTIMCRLTSIPEESMLMIRSFFKSIGVPTMVGTGDGERLCSRLCSTGIAAAVHSTDGDCLAHLSPYVIRGPGPQVLTDESSIVSSYKVVCLNTLIKDLGVTKKGFSDLCIMLGTDYNKNVRGIGPVNSLKLIKEYGSLDDIEWPGNADLSPLKIESTSNLFKVTSVEEVTEITGNIDLLDWNEAIEDNMRMYNMENRSEEWMKTLDCKTEATNYIHMPSKVRSRFKIVPKGYKGIPGMMTESMAESNKIKYVDRNRGKRVEDKESGTKYKKETKSSSRGIEIVDE